jgi:chromosomal replication initiation ATPase DnaA
MLCEASWDRIKARLRSEVTADIYEKWIRRTAGYLGDGEFVISVPDGATRNFFQSKLAITVLGLVRELALPVYEIRYKVSTNTADLEYSEDAPVDPFDDDMNPVTDVIRWRKPKPQYLPLYSFEEYDAPLEDSHWKILGLQPGSTEEQILKAYRKLSFSCHPDHGGNHALFANLRQAYERALAEVRNERSSANDADDSVWWFGGKMKYRKRR